MPLGKELIIHVLLKQGEPNTPPDSSSIQEGCDSVKSLVLLPQVGAEGEGSEW